MTLTGIAPLLMRETKGQPLQDELKSKIKTISSLEENSEKELEALA